MRKKTPIFLTDETSTDACVCSREKANLAVTLANGRGDVVAHASLFDHPVAGLVDQSEWETFLKENFAAHQCTVPIVIVI